MGLGGADRWTVHGRTVLTRAVAGVGLESHRARRRRCGEPRLPHPGGQVPPRRTTPNVRNRMRALRDHSGPLGGTFVLGLWDMTHDAVIQPAPEPLLARVDVAPHVPGSTPASDHDPGLSGATQNYAFLGLPSALMVFRLEQESSMPSPLEASRPRCGSLGPNPAERCSPRAVVRVRLVSNWA